jgi:hypothetical protein
MKRLVCAILIAIVVATPSELWGRCKICQDFPPCIPVPPETGVTNDCWVDAYGFCHYSSACWLSEVDVDGTVNPPSSTEGVLGDASEIYFGPIPENLAGVFSRNCKGELVWRYYSAKYANWARNAVAEILI